MSEYTVRLHTAIPESYFKMPKLGPDRNNVRRNVLPDQTDQTDSSDRSDKPSDGKESSANVCTIVTYTVS